MMGMCEATKPDDDELVSVAKSYLSMNDSKIFSSEIANDPGTYIFLSARPRLGASNGRRERLGTPLESDPSEERSFYDDRNRPEWPLPNQPLASVHFAPHRVVFDQLPVAERPHWTMSATGLAAF